MYYWNKCARAPRAFPLFVIPAAVALLPNVARAAHQRPGRASPGEQHVKLRELAGDGRRLRAVAGLPVARIGILVSPKTDRRSTQSSSSLKACGTDMTDTMPSSSSPARNPDRGAREPRRPSRRPAFRRSHPPPDRTAARPGHLVARSPSPARDGTCRRIPRESSPPTLTCITEGRPLGFVHLAQKSCEFRRSRAARRRPISACEAFHELAGRPAASLPG